MSDERDAITMHAQECEQCLADPPALAEAVALLRVSQPPDPACPLPGPVLLTALRRQAQQSLGRRVAFALAISLLPLPLVLAYDALVLRVAYQVIGQWLPVEIAAYAVFSYAALCLFLISLTYAAVPVLLTKAGRPQGSFPIGATP